MSCYLLAVAEELIPEKEIGFKDVRLYALICTRTENKIFEKLNFQAKSLA
jgi:hypothetical protein